MENTVTKKIIEKYLDTLIFCRGVFCIPVLLVLWGMQTPLSTEIFEVYLRHWDLILLYCILEVVNTIGFMYGLRYTSVVNSTLISNLNVVISALIGFALGTEKIQGMQLGLIVLYTYTMGRVLGGTGEVERGTHKVRGEIYGFIAVICRGFKFTLMQYMLTKTELSNMSIVVMSFSLTSIILYISKRKQIQFKLIGQLLREKLFYVSLVCICINMVMKGPLMAREGVVMVNMISSLGILVQLVLDKGNKVGDRGKWCVLSTICLFSFLYLRG